MLSENQESDFAELKEIAEDRLLPSGISVGLIGMLIFSGVMNAVLLFATSYSSYITHPIWDTIKVVSIGIFILQTVITLFYFNEKRAFRYQKFQSVFVCFITLKISVEFYLIYFLAYEDKFAPAYIAQLGIVCLVSGLIFLVISIIRAVKRVKQGHFQKGQKGLFDFSNSKSYASLPIIFGVTMMAGAIPRILNDLNNPFSSTIEFYIMLFLAVVLQFSLAMAIPEFLLLAYCKYKFPSFTVKIPKR